MWVRYNNIILDVLRRADVCDVNKPVKKILKKYTNIKYSFFPPTRPRVAHSVYEVLN